jgi:tight adherence protein C
MAVLPVLALAALAVLYRKKKVEKRLFLFILCGTLLGLALTVKEEMLEERLPVTRLEKGGQGTGSGEISLEVETEDGDRTEILLQIPEKTYGKEQAETLLEEKLGELDGIILGENRSFAHIDHDLFLPSGFSGSPVTVRWSTDRPEVLSWEGEIGAGAEEGGTEVCLEGILTLQEQTADYRRILTVYPSEEPLSLEERVKQETERLNSREEADIYYLPEEVEGEKLVWYRPAEQTGVLVTGLSLLAGALALLSRKREQEKEALKRKEELQKDYPDVVSRIQLLMGAGLSLRKAFERMTEDYRKGKEEKQNGKKQAAYEEIARACYEMQSGVPEAEAYERLGMRCGTASYRGLSLILIQNLRKGTQGILPLLEQEAQAAFEARKRSARAEGEKAAVRLLLPMGLMLLVVLAVLMVPAMLSL